MSNSPLICYTKLSPNCTKPRNRAIDTISIHCVVGQLSVESILNLSGFVNYNPVNGASCNYAIGVDGRIGMGVDEKNRSWCTSSGSNDHRAITIEVASDTTHPYAVNSKAYAALLDLVTDICKRNNIKRLLWKADKSLIGQADKQNMTVHRWFANKACPGDYLYNRHAAIADEVNKRLNGSGGTTTPPEQESPSTGPSDGSNATFSVGDVVLFAGGPHYASSTATNTAGNPAAGPAKVTAVAPGAKHPYHVVHTDANSAVYGWVGASSLSNIGGNTESGTYTVQAGDSLWAISARLLGNGSRYTEIQKLNGLTSELITVGQKLKIPGGSAGGTTPPAKAVSVGSVVRLNKGAKTYTGGSLAGFVYERDHIVSQLDGDRAVITYGGVTVAAVRVSDLTLK